VKTMKLEGNPLCSRLRRMGALFATVIALAAASLSIGPVSSASAITTGQYCWGHSVPGWGQCSSVNAQYLVAVFGKGGQHAACTNAYYWGALASSWACAGTNEWASISYNGARLMSGAVMNNTASSNVLYGEMWW
jgi:hypothetical protein